MVIPMVIEPGYTEIVARILQYSHNTWLQTVARSTAGSPHFYIHVGKFTPIAQLLFYLHNEPYQRYIYS